MTKDHNQLQKEDTMSNYRVTLGIYNDEQNLLGAARQFKAKGIKVKDVFSPCPIHGIDDLIGVPRTRLAICAFIYGATGLSLALLMMWYMMISDWQINIGGKPNFALYQNIPAFIPVTFESTVLCAAHLMFITFLLRSKLFPGVTAPVPDLGTTDDKFAIQVWTNDANESDVKSILNNNGPVVIKG